MSIQIAELYGLFASAFLSATFFPFQSELVFIALIASERQEPWLLLLVASTGNTLGAVLNWWLGRGIAHFGDRRWFPVKKQALEKAGRWFMRWGKWSLLLSWVPLIGDPLTVAAGVLRMRFLPFVTIVALAKTGRYAALMLIMG